MVHEIQTTSPLNKGDALEGAVHAIEKAILGSNPELNEKTFTIEGKKHVSIGDVRHEIDVYVEVDLGKGYKSTFIFECKNWKKPVGKNELIIFSEKIDALQAQKGFFVAKSYTRDAKAQAKKDQRVTLLLATDFNVDDTLTPFNFHYLVQGQTKARIEIVARHRSSSGPGEPIELDGASVTLRGGDINFKRYVYEWLSELYTERTSTFLWGNSEGAYELEAKAERVFEVNELIVDSIDVGKVNLFAKFSVRIIRPPVVSHFEVSTRGRFCSFAPVTIYDREIKTSFTTI